MSGYSRLTLDDLHPMAVVAQCLDNQWVPGGLLAGMIDDGRELADVRPALATDVRAEYIRALVNSPQVVVNRAFLYNNPVVFGDFTDAGPGRDAFAKLLSSGAVVQMLLAEQGPVDPPAFLERQETPNYTMLAHGWGAWTGIVEEAHVHCLRYSWDDPRANAEQIRKRLAGEFTRRAQTLVNLHGPTLAGDLGVDTDTALKIKARLADVTARCAELAARDEFATRERLYAEFVTAPGTDPALGRYDRDKPYVREVKELIDLAYNVNLATGLETLALTPAQALHRTVLQEWEPVKRRSTALSAQQLAELLRGTAFDAVQQTLFIDTFAKLTMHDVWDLRHSEAWAGYMTALRGLLADPLNMFGDPLRGAPAVVGAYLDLLGETTRIATARDRPGVPRRRSRGMAVVIAVEVAGAALELEMQSGGMTVAVLGAVAAPFLTEAAKVTVRLGLRAISGRRERRTLDAALDTRTQVINGWVDSGGRFWSELVRELADLPGMPDAQRLLAGRDAATEGDVEDEVRNALD
jgi:hypothetical protein